MSRLDQLELSDQGRAELERANPALVGAWLAALDRQRGLRSPAGWLIAGVRTGNMPLVVDDSRRAQAVRLAERRVANLGHELPCEAELLEELFGKRALLEPWASDDELRARMVATWRRQLRAPIDWPER